MVARTLALVLALAALGTSYGGARAPAEAGSVAPRYGISVVAPEGWSVRIARGALVAATYPLTVDALWEETRLDLAEDGMRFLLLETSTTNRSPPPDLALYRDLAWPLDFDPGHFREDPDGSTDPVARRLLQRNGRLFQALVESGSRPPAAEALAGLNELLSTLEIAPGDFYAGVVEPPRFTPRPGWHVGDSGVDEADADGEWTTAWASTIPYADAWNALPPFETLGRLPADGAAIWVNLWRDERSPPRWAAAEPPFQLEVLERQEHWEGQVRGIPEHRLWATLNGDTHLDLRVFFGRRDPTPELLAEAQALLDGLVLPDWTG